MAALPGAIAGLAAAAGAATAVSRSSAPPGLFAGRPLAIIGSTLGSSTFWTTAMIAGGAIGLVVVIVRDPRIARLPATRIFVTGAQPLLWGLSLPLLSLLLDPWVFHGTATVLATMGAMLGFIAALGRVQPELEAAERDGSGNGSPAMAAIVVLAVLVPAFLVAPGPPWFHPISGDEPHYLVIARSLWVDGDVEVSNEYDDRLMSPFWEGELSPHSKPGAVAGSRYSIHGSGLGVWLAPWYGAGSHLTEAAFTVMVRIAMSLWLAAGAACLFLLIRLLSNPGVAVRGTALAVFTLPLVFAGPHLFPAVPVFTLSCAAYLLLRDRPGPVENLVAGLLLAVLPWMHFKFFGLMAAVAAVGIAGQWKRQPEGSRRLNISALLAPLAITIVAHTAFTWALYERLSPLAVHVGADPTLRATAAGDDLVAYLSDPGGVLRTAIGYFMDQREGLLVYAPQYLLALAGAAWMLRRRKADAWALLLIFFSVVGPYALAQELGHWAPPARPLTGVLWTLAVPMAIGVSLPAGSGPAAPRRRALRAALVAWGAGTTILLLAQTDLLYHDFNVPRSLTLMRYGAPGLPLSEISPAWVGPDGLRLVPSALWLATAILVGVVLWRWGRDAAASEPTAAGVSAPARHGAAAVILAAGAGLLAHHMLVPVTALHESWAFDEVQIWKPQSPPTRAWRDNRGAWFGGFDTAEMLLSSRQPLSQVVVRVTAFAPMQADVQVGRDRQTLRMKPGEETLMRFVPGPGRSWGDETFYHLNVTAHGGSSPAAIGRIGDRRGLGIHLEVLPLGRP